MIKSEPEGSRSPVHTKFEMQLRPVTSATDQAVLFSSAFTVMYAVKTRFRGTQRQFLEKYLFGRRFEI